MGTFWRDINSYTQGQKRALILIWTLIVASIVFSFLQKTYFQTVASPPVFDSTLTQWAKERMQKQPNQETLEIRQTFDPNTDSLEKLMEAGIPERIANNIIKLRKAGKKYTAPEDLRTIYGITDTIYSQMLPYIQITSADKKEIVRKKKEESNINFTLKEKFDPNNTTLEQLIKIGFPEKLANTIHNYRKHGGKFEKPMDMLRVYSIDSVIYAQIEPFIDIPAPKVVKVDIEKVELNTATARELSKAITEETTICFKVINYRNRLGGFISYNQIDEIEDISEVIKRKILQSTWLDSIQIQKIPLNQADYQTIIRHPYVSKELTEKILRYRNFAKSIKGGDELIKNRITTKKEWEKISPYITFE
jgi:DNA uptake protein ComE-like DNA-binding protein